MVIDHERLRFLVRRSGDTAVYTCNRDLQRYFEADEPCSSASAASTSSLCLSGLTSSQTFSTFPCGSIRKVCRDESLATPIFMTESYCVETSLFVSASNLKLRPSLVQNFW